MAYRWLFTALALCAATTAPVVSADEPPANLTRSAALQILAQSSSAVQFDDSQRVRRITFGCRHCSREALAQLPAVAEVRELSLRLEDRVTVADLAALEQLNGLEVFTAHHTALGDKCLPRLANLPNLRSIRLVRLGSLSEDDLSALAKMPKLESLHLFGMPLSERGLAELGKLADLEELALVDMRLSGPVGVHLSGLTRLKSLWLTQSKGISPEQVRILRAALPETRIQGAE
jgi:hypothetical protein